MRLFGLITVTILLAVPLVYFAPLAAKHDTGAIFSQYLGCAALIAMAIGQVLATRLPMIEPIFGGIDRVYVLHKWLGIGALAAILLHDTIDAEIDGLARETWLTDLAETLGEFSLYGFLALIMITIVTFIPYHLWRWSHKFMGTFFALSAFHFAFITKSFANTDPLGVYVLSICGLGILAYLFTLLPLGTLRRSYAYKVDEVEPTGDALSVRLRPVGKGLKHHAGQFAFASFDLPHLKEVHPFTLSSAPVEDNSIRFTIKPLGDYTMRLKSQLQPGTEAVISSAFGHFRLRSKSEPQIWIAGGIGITPFLAWSQALTADHPKIDLFYCIKGRDKAAHLAEIESAAANHTNLNLHVIDTSISPRLTAPQIQQLSAATLARTQVYFCGPQAMRETLRIELRRLGLGNRRFHFEEFEIRSGIGLRKILAFVIRKTGLEQRLQDVVGRLA